MPTLNQRPHPSGKVVSVRLDPETISRLDALSNRTGRSRGLYLRVALKAMLPVLEKEHWQQRVTKFKDDQMEREFRELTYQLIEEQEAQEGKPRNWDRPSDSEPEA